MTLFGCYDNLYDSFDFINRHVRGGLSGRAGLLQLRGGRARGTGGEAAREFKRTRNKHGLQRRKRRHHCGYARSPSHDEHLPQVAVTSQI